MRADEEHGDDDGDVARVAPPVAGAVLHDRVAGVEGDRGAVVELEGDLSRTAPPRSRWWRWCACPARRAPCRPSCPGSFASISASAAPMSRSAGKLGAALGRQREVAEAEPADRREVGGGAPGASPASGKCGASSAPHSWWNSLPGSSAVVTGATGPSLTNTALPSASCPVTTLRTSMAPPRCRSCPEDHGRYGPAMGERAETYTHGHAESVLRSHRWRTVENSAAYLLPHLRPGVDLLDVGCGPGTITIDLAQRVAPGRVVGIDAAADAIDAARAAAREAGRRNLELATGDVYALDHADDSFDVVHAHQVLQHLADPVAALREMRRVCRPDGVVAARDSIYRAMTWYPASPAPRPVARALLRGGRGQRRRARRRQPPAPLVPRGRVRRGRGLGHRLVLRHRRGAGVVGRALGRPGDRAPPSATEPWSSASPPATTSTRSRRRGGPGRPPRTAGSRCSTARCSPRP